jgi:Zn-dependent protease with chaperone function
MKRWEVIIQTAIFSAGVFMLFLLLAGAVHYPLGRVAFAILISGICLIAELFALFKVVQLMWRMSDRLARAMLRIAQPATPPPSSFDRDGELKHI